MKLFAWNMFSLSEQHVWFLKGWLAFAHTLLLRCWVPLTLLLLLRVPSAVRF